MRGGRVHIGLMGLIGLMALISCSVNEAGMDTVPETGREPITMSAYVAQTPKDTRAGDEKRIPDGGKIGVYAYYHENSTWADDLAADKAIPNFMFNQPVTYHAEENSFTYSPLKYWPNSPEDKLTFIGYYPYCDGSEEQIKALGITPLLENNQSGLPTFKFEVKENPEDQVDLLISDLLADQTKPSINGYSKINLYCRHATPKVRFHITVTDELRKDLASLKVKSLTISNIDTIATYTASETEGVIEHDNIGDSSKEFTIVDASSDVSHLGDIYLMLPQVLNNTATLAITYEVTFRSYRTTYKYNTSTGKWEEMETYSYTRTAEMTMNEMKTKEGVKLTEWEPNKQYIYTIRVDAEEIGFTGYMVEWGDEEVWNDLNVDEIVVP